jgi:hypothetical protein
MASEGLFRLQCASPNTPSPVFVRQLQRSSLSAMLIGMLGNVLQDGDLLSRLAVSCTWCFPWITQDRAARADHLKLNVVMRGLIYATGIGTPRGQQSPGEECQGTQRRCKFRLFQLVVLLRSPQTTPTHAMS